MRPIVLGLLLVSICLPALAQRPQKARDSEAQRILRGYQSRARDIDELLVEGEGMKALRRADRLLNEMSRGFMAGGGTSGYLGTVMVLRALAAVQVDRKDDAIWHWQTAVQLMPAAEKLAMTAYGDAGEFLRGHPPRDAALTECARQMKCLPKEGTKPPRRKKRTPIEFPPGMLGQGRKVVVRVETIIGTDGRVREPVILQSEGELTMVLAVLRGMRTWEYHPATLDGDPIEVPFVLTANFVSR